MDKIGNLLFSALLFLLSWKSLGQCSDTFLKKTAIVIGNDDYEYAPALKNPGADATDMRDALKRMNFEVSRYINSDLKTMTLDVEKWCASTDDADIALFYYAGHGAEYQGENYLFATNSNPKHGRELQFEAYPLRRLTSAFEESHAKIKIILLDACRNNPFIRNMTRSSSDGGLATVSARGTFIGFATSPGGVTEDGAGKNGTYTAAILKFIEVENMTVQQLFTRVGREVEEVTLRAQSPYASTNLIYDVCLKDSRQSSSVVDRNVAQNAKGILQRVKFDSSISDVLEFEFGETMRESISYESLPDALECTNAQVKYYWRYLNQSRMGNKVSSFLGQYGLEEDVGPDSYIMYVFNENKLLRIEMRIFSMRKNFYNNFMNSLSQSLDFKNDKFVSRQENFRVIAYQNEQFGWNMTHLVISNDKGFNICNNDWWTK